MSTSNDRNKEGKFVKGNGQGFSSHPENIGQRPKGKPSLTAAFVRRFNAEETEGRVAGRKVMNAIVEATIKEILEGSPTHLRELWKRMDGYGDVLPELPDGEQTKEDHRNQAIELYRAVVADKNASHRDRLMAQAQLNEMLGLMEDNTTPSEAARRIQRAVDEMMDVSSPEEDE